MNITIIRSGLAGLGLFALSLLGPTAGVAGDGDGAPARPLDSGLQLFEEAKLTASDGAVEERFGGSVSISGDTLVVGADHFLPGDREAGSAYVYRFDGIAWNEEAKLTASDAAPGDNFGGSVSISGDTLVVGAAGDDEPEADTGSAYVYRFDGVAWNEEAELTAGDATAFDRFGASVSISGNTVVVGASRNDDAGVNSGSAYVYRFDGVTWNPEAKLTASDAAAGDVFGSRVSISGDTVVVGAPDDDDACPADPDRDCGSAYVFRRTDGIWSEEAKLTASDVADRDGFGASVSISGDTAVAGVPDKDETASNTGAAYIFRRSGGIWTEEAKLAPSCGGFGCFFGIEVFISGNVIAAGGPKKAYLFRRSGGTWAEEELLFASDLRTETFANSLSISGDTVVAGDELQDDLGANSGAAYVYLLPPPGRSPEIVLVGSCPGLVTLFASGMSPSTDAAITRAASEGAFAVPSGRCAGTLLDLDAPTIWITGRADRIGAASGEVTLDAADCGLFVQVIDGFTCTTSNVAQVP